MHMKTLTIHLDSKLEHELSKLAKSQHKTKSAVARNMLRRHIRIRKLDDLREQLSPYAKAAGYLTDEDFFRGIS